MAQGGLISASIPVDTSATDISNALIVDVPCHSSVYVGAVVRFSAGVVYNALADAAATSNIVGIIESKSSPTVCTVRVSGVTNGVFTLLDDTKVYFLSDTVAGGITVTPPNASGHVMVKVGVPFDVDKLVIDKGALVIRS